jgi:hypothetical protein
VLTGTVKIPYFTGCVNGPDNLDPIFDATISGPGNFAKITQGLICSPVNDNDCPPRIPLPKH